MDSNEPNAITFKLNADTRDFVREFNRAEVIVQKFFSALDAGTKGVSGKEGGGFRSALKEALELRRMLKELREIFPVDKLVDETNRVRRSIQSSRDTLGI